MREWGAAGETTSSGPSEESFNFSLQQTCNVDETLARFQRCQDDGGDEYISEAQNSFMHRIQVVSTAASSPFRGARTVVSFPSTYT